MKCPCGNDRDFRILALELTEFKAEQTDESDMELRSGDSLEYLPLLTVCDNCGARLEYVADWNKVQEWLVSVLHSEEV